jgi:hypothetical protein
MSLACMRNGLQRHSLLHDDLLNISSTIGEIMVTLFSITSASKSHKEDKTQKLTLL